MAKGYRLDAKSVEALKKLVKFGRAAPVAPPVVPARLRIREVSLGQMVGVRVGASAGTTSGWYTGKLLTGRATADTVTSGNITGMSNGSSCSIFNGPEINWTGAPLLPPGPNIGLKVGVDGSGVPIVLIGSFNPGPCPTP